ncbi:MAG: hypothetical protein ACO1O1_13610 [Adhaeribacter sp.]
MLEKKKVLPYRHSEYKHDERMSTRAENQQKKQRQKEFKERKEHQELLKAAAKKAKRGNSGNPDEMGGKRKKAD